MAKTSRLLYKWRSVKRFVRWIPNGLRNVWSYLPVIWDDCDGENTHVYRLLLHKLRKKRMYFEKSQLTVGWEEQVHQIRTCETLLDRILNKGYESTPEYRRLYDISPEKAYRYVDSMEKQDRSSLFMLINKHLDTWWD